RTILATLKLNAEHAEGRSAGTSKADTQSLHKRVSATQEENLIPRQELFEANSTEVTSKQYSLGKQINECNQETELKKQADLMCQLGDEYIKTAEISNIWYEHYVWACALFNAAQCRLEKLWNSHRQTNESFADNPGESFYDKDYIEQRKQVIETNFLRKLSIQNKTITTSAESTSRYKQILKSMREYSKTTVNDIINNDMIVDELTSEIKEPDEDRTIANSRSFYDNLTEKIFEFYRLMLKDCMTDIGIPECKFAMIALGSISRKEVTAYSDIE
ncbi:unnamed protein product, partial [Owenia fusiformis]